LLIALANHPRSRDFVIIPQRKEAPMSNHLRFSNRISRRQLYGWLCQGFLFLALATVIACSSGGDGGGGAPPPPPPSSNGTLSGRIISSAGGTGIANATVEVGSTKATSLGDGSYTLSIPPGERVVLHVEAPGFAENYRITRIVTGQTTALTVQLLPVGTTEAMQVATGGTVSVPNSTAQVVIPASGLSPSTGGTPAASVNLALTPVNPATGTANMPGDFTTVSTTGNAVSQIDSFGAMLVDIRDNVGTRYNLSPGKQATIRIPLGTRSADIPPTIPLFFFDGTTGRWVQEGTATLSGTAPNQYYQGTVTHFSYWNADRITDTVFVTGCVRNSSNQPVGDALVETDGIDYSGSSRVYTAADGSFRIPIRRNSRATVTAVIGSQLTNTATAGPSSTDFTLDPCLVATSTGAGINIKLTWGQNPEDLDSHLFSPNGGHVYFVDQGSLTALPFANLDVDDIDSFGPEVVTITRLMQGTYQYLVHNFSQNFNPGITASPTRVELTRGGGTNVFVPPAGEGTRLWWHVFNIVVDAQCSISVVPVNAWLDAPSPPTATQPTFCDVN
jgi:hypothetical protein